MYKNIDKFSEFLSNQVDQLIYFYEYFKVTKLKQSEVVGGRDYDKESYAKFRAWMISVFTVNGEEKEPYENKLFDMMMHNFLEIQSLDQFRTTRMCLPRDVNMMDNKLLQHFNSRFHRSVFQPDIIDKRYSSGPSSYFCMHRDDTNNQLP